MTRLLLTLATLAAVGACYALMLKGWRSRQRRNGDLPLPAQPSGQEVAFLGPVPGLFVGTTGSEHWLDRVNAHHLSDRASGTATVVEQGLVLARPALPDLLIPSGDLVSSDLETALGGKVVSTGMLVVTWRLGDRVLRTAFRADERTDNEALRAALSDRIAAQEVSP